MLESLQALDRTVFLALNGMHTPYLDSFMYIFTSKLVWIPLYASILYVLYKNMNIRMVIFTTLMFALLIALADQTCSSILRPIFERPRPSRNPDIADMVHLVNGKRGGKFGFPSCHAANTFALACFMMLLFKNRALTTFFMLWAIVTCYTRVYVGVHYPGDLLFGTVVGFAVGAVTYGIYRFCLRVDSIANGLKFHLDPTCNTRQSLFTRDYSRLPLSPCIVSGGESNNFRFMILDSAALATVSKMSHRGLQTL